MDPQINLNPLASVPPPARDRSRVMRRLCTVAVLVLATLPSSAAKRASVAQLEEVLKTANAAHKSDPEIARQIGNLKPSERISDATLARLSKQFAPGKMTFIALQLLGDKSSFLALPSKELPAIPAPDPGTQQKQLIAARQFAIEKMPQLPNLLATKTTYSFNDSLQHTQKGWGERDGLHLVNVLKDEISVRDERANVQLGEAAHGPLNGLVTGGEFGSALLLILSDSADGKIAWSHWEQTASGLLSVFDYSVPKTASHYEIVIPVQQALQSGASGRWAGRGDVLVNGAMPSLKVERTRPPYHGSIWIDPASGAILRISLIANLSGDTTLENAAVLIEYGPVRMKSETFICPIRSLALSEAPASVNATLNGATTEWLNENIFSNYHIFASTARLITGEADSLPPQTFGRQGKDTTTASATAPSEQPVGPLKQATPLPQPEATSDKPHPPLVVEPASPTTTESQPPSVPSTNQVAAESAPPVPSPSLPVIAPPTQQLVPAAVNAPPASASSGTAPANTGTTLHVNINVVQVPVVVRDASGRSVSDLQRGDFQVFDDGKLRQLSGFLVENDEPSQRKVETLAASWALPNRVTVFVFDDMHLNHEQIASVQKAAMKGLDGALTGSDVAAVVSTSGKMNSGLTRDKAKLSAAIMALRPLEVYRSKQIDCPNIDYYQADLIVNQHNPDAFQDAVKQVMFNCNPNLPENLAEDAVNSTARRVLRVGQLDVLSTYTAIGEFIERIAKMPGQHLLILVSPGFVPIGEDREAESRLIDLAANSNVAINALDARGLYTTTITASENIRNRDPSLIQDFRENEMRTAENSMGELADSTGGTFFHNSNDLEAGFSALLDSPATTYLLELPLDNVKPNGAYHRLSIKVNRSNSRVRARSGYFAPDAHPKPKRAIHND
jgi:VWFA-related protein